MAISTSYEKLTRDGISNIESYLKRLSETIPDTNYYTDENGLERKIAPVNHFPVLKEYEVWCQGYRVTGESAEASLLGKAMARNWGQACHIVMCENYLKNQAEYNTSTYTGYVPTGRWDYDPSRFTYWACRLYDNEADARKSFG